MHAPHAAALTPSVPSPLRPPQDSCIAIDLEWKPEGWAGSERSTRVALMQLASATTAVLVRISHLKFRMPQQLRDFLRWALQSAPECSPGAAASPCRSVARLLPAPLARRLHASVCTGITCPSSVRHLPACLPACSDPELTFVGFSWDGADELKMQATFGAGRKLFSRFHDLQQVCGGLSDSWIP